MDNKEFTQKYNKDNPYYKGEGEFVTGLSDEEEKINAERVKKEMIGETKILVEKEFLEKLKDFEYWKEWKNQ
tara:strand:- start:2703 stop:2918 length:216 start_codon:yes stop_codon:yes gene_type:complete